MNLAKVVQGEGNDRATMNDAARYLNDRHRALQSRLAGPGELEESPPLCFCETNPPFPTKNYFISILLSKAYVVCRAFLQVGSFSKTNPPEGCF